MKIFVVQYAHLNDGFDGWHSIAAYADQSKAEERLRLERVAYPEFRYQVRPLEYVA